MLHDLTVQRQILTALGVLADRIYLDKGLTGTSRARPGLDQALAAVRSGDTLVVPSSTGSPAPFSPPATSATPFVHTPETMSTTVKLLRRSGRASGGHRW